MNKPKNSNLSPYLPSSYKKSTSEDIERTPESEPDESILTKSDNKKFFEISPTALSKASQCLLRGLWTVQGIPAIGPSPFTQAALDDGRAFEEVLLESNKKTLWICAINQAMKTDLPPNLKIIKGNNLKVEAKETAQEFKSLIQKKFNDLLPKDLTEPFALHEPFLASEEPTKSEKSRAVLRGRPDLLIQTGNRWIIADIKCSEEARRTHGIQIAAYARMLAAMRPDDKIDPHGVVIHCAPGYRFTADSSEADRDVALSNTLATPFPIAELASVVDEEIRFLVNADDDSESYARGKAVFSAVCNECGFRHRCYPRFLKAKHVSLAPLPKSELEVVMGAKIKTLDALLDAIKPGNGKKYKTLLELKERSPQQLIFLRQKVEKVLDSGLYSSWRASSAETENALFFVSIGEDFCFRPSLTAEIEPSCLVVYSEAERRRAWAKMRKIKNHWGIPEFVLSKEVQKTLHGPIPSLTLRPLANLLRWAKDKHPLSEFRDWLLKNYSDDPAKFEQSLQELSNIEKRLEDLKTVWDFLRSAAISFAISPSGQ